jgi:hypothetical protein
MHRLRELLNPVSVAVALAVGLDDQVWVRQVKPYGHDVDLCGGQILIKGTNLIRRT